MPTISGDRARCVIQMPDGTSFVLGLRDFRATMPPPEPVRLDPTDIYTGAPPRHYVGHGDSGTFTAKLCPPPPEPEPRTDAERLARAVLAGDQVAAGPLADLVQETWQGGKPHGAAILVLERLLKEWQREAQEARQQGRFGMVKSIQSRYTGLRLAIAHLKGEGEQ